MERISNYVYRYLWNMMTQPGYHDGYAETTFRLGSDELFHSTVYDGFEFLTHAIIPVKSIFGYPFDYVHEVMEFSTNALGQLWM